MVDRKFLKIRGWILISPYNWHVNLGNLPKKAKSLVCSPLKLNVRAILKVKKKKKTCLGCFPHNAAAFPSTLPPGVVGIFLRSPSCVLSSGVGCQVYKLKIAFGCVAAFSYCLLPFLLSSFFFFFWLSHSLTHEYSCAYLTGRDYCSLKPTWECPEVVVCLRMQFTGLMDTDGWGPHSLLLPFPEDLWRRRKFGHCRT